MPCASSNELCLECGLCCNGVIFAGVRLEPEDDAGLLRSLGLPVAPAGTGSRRGGRGRGDQSTEDRPGFRQPCAALKGCRCRIYADRPKYCREFECMLLKNMQAGRLEKTSARRVIRATLGRVEEVRRLLLELGDADDARALSLRFRRVEKRLESASADPESAEIFSRLTLAVHGLNLCLGESFYPGPAQG